MAVVVVVVLGCGCGVGVWLWLGLLGLHNTPGGGNCLTSRP